MLGDIEVCKNLSRTGWVKQELLRKDVLNITNIINPLRRKQNVLAHSRNV